MIPLKTNPHQRFLHTDIRFRLIAMVLAGFCLLILKANAVSVQQSVASTQQPTVNNGILYERIHHILGEANAVQSESSALYDQFQTQSIADFAGTVIRKYSHHFIPRLDPETLNTEPNKGSLAYIDEQILYDFQNLGEIRFIESSEQLDDQTTGKINVLVLQQPLHRPKVSSRYGWRHGRPHTGIDFSAPVGTPILASSDGRVVFSSYDAGYGNLITIDHGEGVYTRYAHCSKRHVRVGQIVKRGQIIGRVGTTGRSTGPHLHFEIMANGYHLNPEPYLPGSPTHTARTIVLKGSASSL